MNNDRLMLITIVFVTGTALIALAKIGTNVTAAPDDDHLDYLPIIFEEEETATPTPSPTPNASPTPRPTRPPGVIVVDHTSVADFERIPPEYINAAASLNMLFVDRSVGQNISDGLECLSYPTDEEAPSHCVEYEHVVPEFSVDPSELNWSWGDDYGYDRSNWEYRFWEGTDCSQWYGKLSCFFEMTEPVIGQYDVVSQQFSYLSVDESSTIINEPGGFFWDNPDRADVYDHEAFEAQHSNTIFIYWTTSLARSIGSTVSEEFNDQMRQYAIENEKILFDVADILSHDPDGNPCYDNRDGVPYRSENEPDDGLDIPAICQHYTTEAYGGHLGSVSAGKIRVAKAFWVLMAQIAGWDGN